MDGYFYVDEPRTGAMNMAIDRRLVELADLYRCALLRVYQWAQPTLSLGYFQSIAQRQSHPTSLAIDCVRRSSGGGAIVHHYDWTYAVALPGERNRTGASTQLYDCVHDSLVDFLRQLGWDAAMWDTGSGKSLASDREGAGCVSDWSCRDFLCFHRRSVGDIVVGQHKVLGSAQRRFERCVLQHGSLLLLTSPHAPSLPGLLDLALESEVFSNGSLYANGRELRSVPADVGSQLAVWITEGLKACFGVDFAEMEIQGSIGEQLGQTTVGNFAEDSWTSRR